MKKILFAVIAALALLTQAIIPTAAVSAEKAEEIAASEYPALQYAYANYVSSGISISKGAVYCQSNAAGNKKTTKISATQYLEKKSGSRWSICKVWIKTSAGAGFGMINGTNGCIDGTYRLRTVFRVFSGSKYETITKCSAEKLVRRGIVIAENETEDDVPVYSDDGTLLAVIGYDLHDNSLMLSDGSKLYYDDIHEYFLHHNTIRGLSTGDVIMIKNMELRVPDNDGIPHYTFNESSELNIMGMDVDFFRDSIKDLTVKENPADSDIIVLEDKDGVNYEWNTYRSHNYHSVRLNGNAANTENLKAGDRIKAAVRMNEGNTGTVVSMIKIYPDYTIDLTDSHIETVIAANDMYAFLPNRSLLRQDDYKMLTGRETPLECGDVILLKDYVIHTSFPGQIHFEGKGSVDYLGKAKYLFEDNIKELTVTQSLEDSNNLMLEDSEGKSYYWRSALDMEVLKSYELVSEIDPLSLKTGDKLKFALKTETDPRLGTPVNYVLLSVPPEEHEISISLSDNSLGIFSSEPTSYAGDINLDGTVNIADVIAFQRSLSEGTAAIEMDFNNDGKLNVFDLVALKQVLIENIRSV